MSTEKKPLGTIELDGSSFTLDFVKALSAPENTVPAPSTSPSAEPETVKAPPEPESKTPPPSPPNDPKIAENSDEPENANDIIARKQAWFNRPGLSLIFRQLRHEDFAKAVGIRDYDSEKFYEIIDRTKRKAPSIFAYFGSQWLGFKSIQAIDTAKGSFEYKRAALLFLISTLSKITHESRALYMEELKGKGETFSERQAALDRIVEGDTKFGWADIIDDDVMSEKVFDYIIKYDLVAPFYFLLNSTHTHAPKEATDFFRGWCQHRSVNLHQALLDYELIDTGELEPSNISSDNDNEPEEDNTPKAVALDGAVIQRIFREAEKSHPNNSTEREDDIARMKWLSDQLRALASLEIMNAKFEPHAELAETLFGDDVMRALEASHLLPNSKKKIPTVLSETRDSFAKRLAKIFTITSDNADIRSDDLERNEKLKEHIAEFPGLVIAGLTIDQSLRQLRDKYNIPLLSDIPPHAERDLSRRAVLEFERNKNARKLLLTLAGIELPAIELEEPPIPETPSNEELEEEIGTQPSTESLPMEDFQEVSEPPEDTIADEPEEKLDFEEVIIEDDPTEELDDEKNTDHSADVEQVEDEMQVAEIFSGAAEMFDIAAIEATTTAPLSEEEKLELLIKYEEAFVKTKERLLADAQMYLMQAQNRRCNQFNCFIDLNKPGFAIHLRFFGAVDIEGEQKTRQEFYVLNNYDDAFKELGIPLTMEKAVDLKIAVQSLILNTEEILPTRNLTAKGNTAVARDTQMPLPMLDYSIVKDGTGMCAFVYEAKDPYNKGKIVKPRIPLGFAMRYEDEAAEQKELDERAEFVVDYLSKVESYRTPEGFRVHVYKRDVMDKLQSFLELTNKEWETVERMALTGFEEPTLVHTFSQSAQKITLAPVSLAMDVGGENPSWHCDLSFYVGDKNESTMGQCVRTRSLYLRTRNHQLAIARTLDTLNGFGDISTGLLPSLREHMSKTEDEWRVEKSNQGDEIFIGSTKLQDFLDDMTLYERDIGVKLEKRETIENGNVKITLQALRCLIGDRTGNIRPTPEYVYEKKDGTRKPIAFSMIVPKDKVNEIDDFIDKVGADIRWHADEAYCSRAIGQDGQPDKRKRPLEYRAIQIRNALIRAVEAICESHFGYKLPKKWYTPEAQAALISEPSQNGSSTPEVGLS